MMNTMCLQCNVVNIDPCMGHHETVRLDKTGKQGRRNGKELFFIKNNLNMNDIYLCHGSLTPLEKPNMLNHHIDRIMYIG